MSVRVRRVSAVVIASAPLLLTASPTRAATAGALHLPDLQNIIPASAMSLVTTPTGREFRYTHQIYNGGSGPFEIMPQYSQAAGNYRGMQRIYTHDVSGRWSVAQTRRVAGAFSFHAEHGHFHFPMASFGLWTVAPDGGIGQPAAVSPKNGFCIADSFIVNPSIEHAGTFGYTGGTCTDPSAVRGISVGGADEYDYRDPGQAVPVNNLPDGTYWFRAISDPDDFIAESNEANNETDVKVTIAGGSVVTGETTHPDSTGPQVALSEPVDGATLSGTVTLTASSTSALSKVQFLLDGSAVGSAVTSAPWTTTWSTAGVTNGTHWLAAEATDARGRSSTSSVAEVVVANQLPPPTSNSLALDSRTSVDGRTSVTAGVSTGGSNDLLLAFVAADGPTSGQRASLSGGGLSWTLVSRAGTRPGVSEVWQARASVPLVNVPITASLAAPNYDETLTVIGLTAAQGVGATATAAATTGAPSASLTPTARGSLVFAVGNDWDKPVTHTPLPGQTLVHEWADTRVGDTFWVQAVDAPTDGVTTVRVGSTSPTTDQWNLAVVEVVPSAPASPPPADTTAPSVSVTEPTEGATVRGTVTVAATATDNVAVSGVTFAVDGVNLGPPDTSPPFTATWDTRTAAAGPHRLIAVATDAAGNSGTSQPVNVTVDNSGPARATITVDGQASRDATGTLTATGLTFKGPNDVLVAFAAHDGPRSGGQTATVSGGGLTWSLVKRSNLQYGTSEIWTATAPTALVNAAVTSTPALLGYSGSLTVVAYAGAAGVGVAAAASAPTGEPDVYVPGVQAGSWVVAVGNDWDRAIARTPSVGQTLLHQYLDTRVGDTFWVQATAAPSVAAGVVDIHDTAPATDRWNYAAVEVLPAVL